MNTSQVFPPGSTAEPIKIETTGTELVRESPPIPTAPDILLSKRPLSNIETEILLHSQKAAENFFTLGGALIEAKEIVEPGYWIEWLSKKVYISPREAQRYMQVARAYNDYATSVTPLGLTKAHILLKVPDDERKEFISKPHEVTNGQQKTVYDMTVKELKKVITKKWGTKNKDTLTPVRRPDNKKIHNYITSVNEQLNGVRSYLKEYASDPDVRKEFHDSVCSISEVINKCVGLVNPETLSTSAIEDGEEGEES